MLDKCARHVVSRGGDIAIDRVGKLFSGYRNPGLVVNQSGLDGLVATLLIDRASRLGQNRLNHSEKGCDERSHRTEERQVDNASCSCGQGSRWGALRHVDAVIVGRIGLEISLAGGFVLGRRVSNGLGIHSDRIGDIIAGARKQEFERVQYRAVRSGFVADGVDILHKGIEIILIELFSGISRARRAKDRNFT